MKIQVDLEPRDVWRIQEKAERLGITPGEVLRGELAETKRGRDARDVIRQSVADGLCDADIAAELRATVGHVASVRRSLGLPANHRYRFKGVA